VSAPDNRSRVLRAASAVARVAGAALLAWSAEIHLHLWMDGYRHIPTIGPLFLFQAIGGLVLAALVASTRRLIPTLVGVAFLGSTIGGLVISAWVGLFGFHDGFDAPFAHLSLVVEVAGVALLTTAVALQLATSLGTRGTPSRKHAVGRRAGGHRWIGALRSSHEVR
jgi:hypothetical protein